MTKYKKNRGSNTSSEKTIQDAEFIAKGIQKPGQTKEQTKLVAQGIQKGIEQYKKQYKAKSRNVSKQLKSLSKTRDSAPEQETVEKVVSKQHWLPWALLIISWAGFATYLGRY
mgnify:CR=1 FL=1